MAITSDARSSRFVYSRRFAPFALPTLGVPVCVSGTIKSSILRIRLPKLHTQLLAQLYKTGMNRSCPKHLTYQIIFIFLIQLVGTSFSVTLDGQQFATVINALANDGLGVEEYQKYVDLQINHVKEDLNGHTLVQSMASSVNAKITEWVEAVSELRDTLEADYDDTSDGNDMMPECCTATLGERDFRFKQRVNNDEICVVGEGLKQPPVRYIQRDKVLEKMKQIMNKVPSLKWQYFASEQGVLFNYPTMAYCDARYDPRFRPFYVEVASPQAKDMVIIIDTSGSMTATHDGRTLMQIAIDAATTVINTLGPNDRVGIVAFSTKPRTPSGTHSTSTCYSDSLAMATPKNKENLVDDFLVNLRASGATFYGSALTTAFQYFINTPENMTVHGQEREKLILFLSDGAPSDTPDSIMTTLREENAKLGNKVITFTFGLGQGNSWQTLIDMAKQTTADNTAGEVKQGQFIAVSNPSDLRSKMGSYYTYISKTGSQPQVVFSVPYNDYFGLGILVSGCLPVYHHSQLKGVVCIDRTISDFLSGVTYFNKGQLNYAFVIDGQARVLTHPLLPRPQTMHDDPLFIRLTSLERSSQTLNVMTSMIRGDAGNLTYSSERVSSRGNTMLEGVKTRNLRSTYFWAPVGHTHFSICVVLADEIETFSDVWSSDFPEPFVYHRLDLTDQPNQCSYLQRIALKDKTTVKFAPTAFVNPYEYLDTEETRNDVDRYELYMLGKTNPTYPDFKKGVRESVASTLHFDTILSTRAVTYAPWRFIGTEAGVFRTFPGKRMVKEYDHTERPWYKRGKMFSGLVTFSTPYLDASGAGIILTLSHSISEGRASELHSKQDAVSAVMGMDFTLPYLYYRMLETYPDCSNLENRCFLMDTSGFIVLHKDFIEVGSSTESVQDIHVSSKEPMIAQDLVARNIMKEAACVSVENFSNQYFWKISLLLSLNGRLSTSSYTLAEVPGSNVFIVMATGSPSNPLPQCTWCEMRDSLPVCSTDNCHCPCYKRSDIYEYCRDTFSLHSDGWPVCVPQPAVADLEDLKAEESAEVARLTSCFTYSCNGSRSNCVTRAGCSFCTPDQEKLDEQFCTTRDNCIALMEQNKGTSTIRLPLENDAGSSSNLAVILPAVLVPLIIIIVAGAVFIYCRKHKSNSPSTNTHSNGGFQMDNSRPPPTAPPTENDLPPPYTAVYT